MGFWRTSVQGIFSLALLASAGCHEKSSAGDAGTAQRAGQKVYRLRGRIVATNEAKGEVTVDHKAIAGFMPAMTMPYKLRQPGILGELHTGDEIIAKVLVNDETGGAESIRLDEIDVVAQANVNRLPEVQYHLPKVGETVPDFTLLDQSGRRIDLKQFRGKVLLMTFIYTRCPLPDFCVRMSNNFEKIDTILAQNKEVYARTHLLSVSFDPQYDTPAVLRSYGGAHTGRFKQEAFGHWTFAAPSVVELPKMEQYFDIGVSGTNPSTLTHSLSTVLIGKDGRVIDWYPTNTWDPTQVAEQMMQAAALQ